MDRPLVSIVVPVFNGARYLREAVDSLLAQTYQAVEILLMDDASTDETPSIAQAYGAAIRYHRQPINRGIYDNVNTGIAMARGQLIATYHADDIYEPTIVERQVSCFEKHPELGAVFCLAVLADADGREYARMQLPPEVRGSRPLEGTIVFNALLMYQNILLVCPTAMVPAAVHKKLGVYRQDVWKNSSDLDMWIRILRDYPMLVLEEYLMRYRHFPDQSSRRYHRLRREPGRYFSIMDHHLAGGLGSEARPEALKAYEAHRAQDLLMITVNYYITGDVASATSTLNQISPSAITSSNRIQRIRMVILYLMLRIACRFRRVPLLAALFYWRWQSGRLQGGRRGLHGLGQTLRAWWRDEQWLSEPMR
jgi:glycosyltransferase involved in cell wall biosynthesis